MLDPDRRHLIAYVAAAAVLVVIAVRFIGHHGGQPPAPQVAMAAPMPPASAGRMARPRAAPAARSVWVDVAGAVRRPGLYALPDGARVAAALEKAGGLRGRAERSAVNLAARLSDGQQVLVPLRGQAAPAASGAAAERGVVIECNGTPHRLDFSADLMRVANKHGAKISLSTASEAELEQLDGVGPALAGRIIAYRQAHGGFRSIDQLQEVSGIGDKRMQALRGSVTP